MRELQFVCEQAGWFDRLQELSCRTVLTDSLSTPSRVALPIVCFRVHLGGRANDPMIVTLALVGHHVVILGQRRPQGLDHAAVTADQQ